ncbi:hypothetical protein [Tahibacter amnicola]|uniref:YD repeat-containing protein n=1 Tax=Tahibacter amnicola TaxID=2976241 RepID=A0ABY6BBK7_9GAMM|nr:hypothetical protein [Tahibacter amnicola]UXI66931.1 hypothetical protein N4264_19555 [Tahibacter amnicola]
MTPQQAAAHTYTVQYRTTDRLGSPLGMLDKSGRFSDGTRGTQLSFDIFGKARNRDFSQRTGMDEGQTLLEPTTHNGFTGHEHIGAADIIHMNGRAYDYNLGRFLLVDPFI